MNAALRHFSVRMWLTALTGGLANIYMLPWWQQALGVGGILFPAAVIMGGCFAGVGWGMNRIGLGFLHRHVKETAAWERAGMISEAETAFRKAMGTFDSFWLSPLLRRGKLQWFSGLMARFYMGRASSRPSIRSLVSTHMKHFPRDKTLAEPWLEQLLAYERHLPLEHEAAANVGACLVKDQRIQQLLMQFYLANGRIDFDALQTYRRVWNEHQPLPQGTLMRLSRLLRNEYFLNVWALQVYLKAYEKGDQGAVDGIAAALRWLPENEESRSHLKAAEKIVGDLDPRTPEASDPKFKPALIPPPVRKKALSEKDPKPAAGRPSIASFLDFFKKANPLVDGLRRRFSDRRLQRTAAVLALGAGLTAAAVSGWNPLKQRPVEPEGAQEAVRVQIKITDPFTIQVAAYLKAADARRFVEQLRQSGLDAYWTRATNATNRTWYQVKVSHFADRQGAQKYGQELKTKGLIDDFYVANYEHAQRQNLNN